jgi:[ribosomal protein S5]-alanine N-acetyltransferase
MTESIETQRLRIRQFEADDWVAVYAYASKPEVMTYIPEGVLSAEQAREFVATNQGAEARALAVVLTATNRLIGHLVFHPWFAPRTYEIGWVFNPDYHGQGYATEGLTALLQYGFETLKLHRIIATCQPENVPSYRVMEKLGMRREGWFQKCIYRDEHTWWDEYFYAMLEEEWLSKGVSPS